MTATFLLGAVLGITLRQIRAMRRALTGMLTNEQSCDISWCACNVGDDPLPCESTITYDGLKTCTLPAGHDGMHEHGGWRWTYHLSDEAAA